MSLFFKDFIYLDDLRSLELNDQNKKKSYSFFLKKSTISRGENFKPKFFEDLKKLTNILFSQKMIYFENRMKFRILFEDGNILQIKLKENSTDIEDITITKWIKEIYIKEGLLLNDSLISLNFDKISIITSEEKRIVTFQLEENFEEMKCNFQNIIGIKNQSKLLFLKYSKDFQLSFISKTFPSKNRIIFFEFSKRNTSIFYTIELMNIDEYFFFMYEINDLSNAQQFISFSNLIFKEKMKLFLIKKSNEIGLISISPTENVIKK
jgi:hypothetical protein